MKAKIHPSIFSEVCGALQDAGRDYRSVVKYLDPKMVVRATWQFKPNGRNSRETMILTFGAPNYLERQFIKGQRKKDLAIDNVIVFRPWPKKRK